MAFLEKNPSRANLLLLGLAGREPQHQLGFPQPGRVIALLICFYLREVNGTIRG